MSLQKDGVQFSKIEPIRRKMILISPPPLPSVARSIYDFTSLAISLYQSYQTIARINVKRYKKMVLVLSAKSFVRPSEIEWIEEALNILKKQTKKDSTMQVSLKMNSFCFDNPNVRKHLESMKNLAIINYRSNKMQTKRSLDQMQRWFLTEFSLYFKKMEGLNDYNVTKICKSIVKMRHVRKINLDLSDCQNVTSTGFKKISNLIRRKNTLTHLSLDFQRCSNFRAIELHSLQQSLKKQRVLRELQIDVSDCPEINNTTISGLKQSLVKMEPLENVRLNKNKLVLFSF